MEFESSKEDLELLRKRLKGLKGEEIEPLFQGFEKATPKILEPSVKASNIDENTPFSSDISNENPTGEKQKVKSKTKLRIIYESQAEVIRKEIGDLEEIRLRLGFSKRKICQLLLIDPSSWTRWTSFSGHKVPPHIYRMLQWYLMMTDKYPQLGHAYWLQSSSHGSALHIKQEELDKLRKDINQYHAGVQYDLQIKVKALEKRLKTMQNISIFLILSLGLLSTYFYLR